MKILLVGDMSNLHWTLAEGLRLSGHSVVTVSDGNLWKGFQTDNLLVRKSKRFFDSLVYLFRTFILFFGFRGFDIVQFISPKFLDLKPRWNYLLYIWLKATNKKVFLGAFGDDNYWILKCLSPDGFRYSNFYIDSKPWVCDRNTRLVNNWVHGPMNKLNVKMAFECNGIVACLYEYHVSYKDLFPSKTVFIPLPLNLSLLRPKTSGFNGVVRFFIGIDRSRADWKGSDIMFQAMIRVHNAYPEDCTISKAESIPYNDYVKMIQNSDVLLDQLYSYTPSMNSLMAMAQGLIVVGGGEEENYVILGEEHLRPIINVLPSEDDVFRKLEWLVLNKHEIPRLSRDSIEYVKKHHDYIDVTNKYIDFWTHH